MRQHPDPNPYEDEGDVEQLGMPVYQGTGLSVRALTAEELQQFLDAHPGQSAQLLGSGWAALDPPERPLAGPGSLRPQRCQCRPGRPAAAWAAPAGPPWPPPAAATELAAWGRSLVWRVPLIAATGLTGQVLIGQAGLPRAGLVGLAAAALVGWRLRFRPSEQVTAWRRGAAGERRTARLLERLTGDGFVVFHDLAVPGSPANVDHLVIGPTGVFVIDSKQWTGSVHQGSDGLVWHNHYPLDGVLEMVRWEAQAVGQLLGTRTAAAVCVHGAHVQGGGLDEQGVAIVLAHLLRGALGYDRVLSDADVALLATTAWTSLRPAA